MATPAQANFVTDLAVQAGLLDTRFREACQVEILTWENAEVTEAVQYLRPRVWRSRVPATAKQIAYGAELTEYLSIFTDSTINLDFAAMNCQQATDELTRLGGMIAAFRLLDTGTAAEVMASTVPQPGTDFKAVFDAIAQDQSTHESQNEN